LFYSDLGRWSFGGDFFRNDAWMFSKDKMFGKTGQELLPLSGWIYWSGSAWVEAEGQLIYLTEIGCECGIKGSYSRIVGGEVTKESGEWPWIVVHHRNGKRMGGCGGTLIASNWVLTAAHCFFGAYGTEDFTKQVLSENDMKVVIGEQDITTAYDKDDTKRKDLEIEQIIIHENYNFPQNDIALLKLSNNLDLFTYTPACLPPKNKDWTGQTAWVYGWGRTKSSVFGSLSPFLKETSVTIYEMACQGKKSQLCAKDEESGSCQGDSGGPLTVEENGKHYLAGIVSWTERLCPTDRPAGYCDVSYMRDWIDRQMENNGGANFCPY